MGDIFEARQNAVGTEGGQPAVLEQELRQEETRE